METTIYIYLYLSRLQIRGLRKQGQVSGEPLIYTAIHALIIHTQLKISIIAVS